MDVLLKKLFEVIGDPVIIAVILAFGITIGVLWRLFAKQRRYLCVKTKCVKVPLKPGCLNRARAWAAEINGRADEAMATLRDEEVFIESVFLDSTPDGDFLIYYMRAKNFERAREVSSQSPRPIDAFHQQFKQDCWAEGRHLEMLIDLTNHDAHESARTT